MSQYQITCCSTADLSEEHFEERGILYTCFRFNLDGKDYPDDYGKSVDLDEFYKKVGAGVHVSTSQVSPEQYEKFWSPILESGKDVLHLTLSSGISGSWNSAMIAKDLIMEKYPDRKVIVIDSLCASSGYGLIVDIAKDMQDAGKTLEECAEEVEKQKMLINHWFFSTDLSSYVRGGRVSKTAAIFGTALHICPLLNVNDEGKLIPRHKCRGKKKVIKEIVQKMVENAENGTQYDGKCYISNSACLEDAHAVRDLIEEKFEKLKGKVRIFNIGTTIGAHTGPGTVALFFKGSPRFR